MHTSLAYMLFSSQACIHRLRQNRHTLVEKLRKCNIEANQSPDIASKKFIEDLMQDEWMDIKANEDSPDIQCACCSQKASRNITIQLTTTF